MDYFLFGFHDIFILSHTKQNYKTHLDKHAKFILIGNNIDGHVNVDCIEFENYTVLQEQLPKVLTNVQCRGEWRITLYQYTEPYEIQTEYGYYKSLKEGAVLLNHDYMDVPMVQMDFFEDRIELICAHVEASENWDTDADDFQQYEVCTEIITLFFT
jgi:hypothetical protein